MQRELDDHDAHNSDDSDLAAKRARLTLEQRATYDLTLGTIYPDKPAPDHFRHAVADTLLKNLPTDIQNFDLGQIMQEEQLRIQEENRQQRNDAAYRTGDPSRPPNSATMAEFIPDAAQNAADANHQEPERASPQQQPDAAAARTPDVEPTPDTILRQGELTRAQTDDDNAATLAPRPNSHAGREQQKLGIYDELRQPGLQSEPAPVTKSLDASEPKRATAAAPSGQDIDPATAKTPHAEQTINQASHQTQPAQTQSDHDNAEPSAPRRTTHADRQDNKPGIYDELKQQPLQPEAAPPTQSLDASDTKRATAVAPSGQDIDSANAKTPQPDQTTTHSSQQIEPPRTEKDDRNATTAAPRPNTHADRQENKSAIYDELKQPAADFAPARTSKTPQPPEPKPETATPAGQDTATAKTDQQLREKLTPDALDTMMARYDQLAHRHDFYTDGAQDKKQSEFDEKHTAERTTERKDQPAPGLDQKAYNPAEHMRIAEQVHINAGYYAVRLKQIDPAESARCQQESQQANKLAMLLRNDLAAGREATPADVVARQDQDAKTKAHNAANTGRTLTDAERAAAPAEAKNQLAAKEKEKAEAARNPDQLSKDQRAALRATGQDNAQDTGRGGGRGR